DVAALVGEEVGVGERSDPAVDIAATGDADWPVVARDGARCGDGVREIDLRRAAAPEDDMTARVRVAGVQPQLAPRRPALRGRLVGEPTDLIAGENAGRQEAA